MDIEAKSCSAPVGYSQPLLEPPSSSASGIPEPDIGSPALTIRDLGAGKQSVPLVSKPPLDITRNIFFNRNQTSLGSEAGMGGFGDVFIGHHSTRGKVALKRPRLMDSEESAKKALRRLAREAATWNLLSHKFVLPFLGIFRLNGQLYLVSPWVEQGHIRSALERNPGIDRFKLITEIASGLSFLHSVGIIHGDIKGFNILYSDDGHPLICDFGLSKIAEASMDTSASMKMVMSAQYAAPEIWDGHSKTTKSDVYAFGITIAEILSGATPYADLPVRGPLGLLSYVCMRGGRPSQVPTHSRSGECYASLWELANECWLDIPDDRPTMSEVHHTLRALRA